VTRRKDPLGHETVITYDKVGNRKTVTDPEGHVTSYGYTPRDELETVTDPLGGVTTTHYTKDGQRKEEIDANGVKTGYGYDADGRLTTITDGAGNVTTLVYGKQCDGTAAPGLAGLLTAAKYPTFCEEYKYDSRGNLTHVLRVLPSANGTGERQTTSAGYDAKRQKISDTNPLNRTTLSAYDAVGRLTSVTDAAGGKTLYGYDARDNRRTVTDASGNTHTFTYDKTGRLKTEARPLGQAIAYEYDPVGNLVKRTSPNGERREYVYDDAYRRTTETHYPKNSATASQTVVYTYDDRNLLSGYTQSGDTHSSAVYVYDAKGQKLDETVTYGSGQEAFSKTIHYAYEPNGLKKSLTYPDGTVQTSTYDKNRLASIAVRGNTIRYQDYQWRMPTKVTMPGATRTLTYDPLQRPTQIKSVSIAGAVIMDYRYIYDAAGNITQRETEDGDYLYSYDAVDRLTGATPPVSLQQSPANPNGLPVEQYTYDPVHNRKTSAHQPGSWSYNANNELNAYGAGAEQQSYRYDANGNTIEQKSGDPLSPSRTRTFLYNAAERLSEVKDNAAVIGKFQYDPMGRRICKETSEGMTWFQYADEGLLAEYAQHGDLARIYGWKPAGLWGADPVWLGEYRAGWKISFSHNDHLLTPKAYTDASANRTWSGLGQAFGYMGEGTEGGFWRVPRYPGQVIEDINLYYNFYRDYSPQIGRYIQIDPKGVDAGVNYYSYANQNALRHFDNLGLTVYHCGGVLHDWYHEWLCVGKNNCAGKYPSGSANILWQDGEVINDVFREDMCKPVGVGGCCDESVFESCVQRFIAKKGKETYSLLFANCMHWVNDILMKCRLEACFGER
jgi:RHS repeat-associated protein